MVGFVLIAAVVIVGFVSLPRGPVRVGGSFVGAVRPGGVAGRWRSGVVGKRNEPGADRKRRRGAGRPRELDMGMVVTEVATRLRSGSSVPRAWQATLEHHGLASAGEVLDLDGVPRDLRRIYRAGGRERRRLGVGSAAMNALPATFAVCRMGHSTGAPVAQVLDACAAGVSEAGESRSARAIALAGPKTSAKMLAALPAFGMFLGILMGVDPIGFLLGTSIGRMALLVGLGFEAAGLMWVRSLVREAEEEHE